MFRLALVAILLSFAPAPTMADDALPSAQSVLDQYVEATGGKAAYEKVKNRVQKGTLEVTGAGIKGTIKITQAAPNKLLVDTVIPNIETELQGTDGEVAWTTSLVSGDRLLDGEEKDVMTLQAAIATELDWKKHYSKAECTGVEDIDGKPAYKLVMTPKTGKPTTFYYDKASHLLVKSVTLQKNPRGELTIEIIPGDFKKVDGIMIPHSATQKVLAQEIVIKLTEVKQNVDLPADTFALPAAIKELIAKAKKDK